MEELEEFINDQVTDLDKMEAAMKQTVANKQLLEKDYQKVNECYNTAKVRKCMQLCSHHNWISMEDIQYCMKLFFKIKNVLAC